MNALLVILIILGIICIILALTIKFKDKRNGYLMLGCGIAIMFAVVIIGIVYLYSLYPLWIWPW